MDSLTLNTYLRQLIELEAKESQTKALLTSLRYQIEENDKNSEKLRLNVKTCRKRLEAISSSVPIIATELIDIEAQNKTLSDQKMCFASKNLDFKQQIIETKESERKKIQELAEMVLHFSTNFGFASDIQIKGQQLVQSAQSLKQLESRLTDQLENIFGQDFEASVSVIKSVKDAINDLKEMRTKAKQDINELKLIDRQQKERFNGLINNNDSKELVDLKIQTEAIERRIEHKENEKFKRMHEIDAIRAMQLERMESKPFLKSILVTSDRLSNEGLKRSDCKSDEEAKGSTPESDIKIFWEKKRQNKKRKVSFADSQVMADEEIVTE